MTARPGLILIASSFLIAAKAQTAPPFMAPDLTYAEEETETVVYNNVSVTYLDRGNGSVILPFMYTGGGFAYWQSFIEAARTNYRVLSPDGASYSLPQLRALIESTNSGPVDLVTHSLASWFAIHFAERNPELVNSLILLEPAYAPDLPSAILSAQAYETSCELRDQPADIMAACRLINGISGAGYFERLPASYLEAVLDPAVNRRVAEAANESDLHPASPELIERGWGFPFSPICETSAKLTVPILIVRGAVSTRSNRIGLDAHQSCLPPHQTIVIAGATHWAHLEKPEEFNESVLKFIAEHRTEN